MEKRVLGGVWRARVAPHRYLKFGGILVDGVAGGTRVATPPPAAQPRLLANKHRLRPIRRRAPPVCVHAQSQRQIGWSARARRGRAHQRGREQRSVALGADARPRRGGR